MMMRARIWACAGALALLVVNSAAAQDDPEGSRWSGTLFYEALQISPGPKAGFWHAVNVGIARRHARGSVALHGISTRRFDLTDRAFAVDLYNDLWSGAYGNLRMAAAPGATVMARVDLRGEVYQALGASELTASLRHQRFELAEVTTFGVGAGHYAGRWYLRPRTLVAAVGRSWSPFAAFTARRYVGEGTDNLVDVTLGGGQEVLEVLEPGERSDGGLEVVSSASHFAGVRIQRYVNANLGVSLGGSYSGYEAIPDRWGISVGVLTRW